MSGDDSTRELRQEHQLILAYLELLSELAAREERDFDGSALAAHYGGIAEFLAAFADRFHHEKEEQLLFERLRPHLSHCNPVEQMLYEHALLREIRAAADAAHRDRDLPALAETCSAIAEVLGGHIFKEDNILYPMAERALAEDDCVALVLGYDEVRERADGGGLRRRFERALEAMRAELAAPTLREPVQVARGRSPAAR